MRNRLPVVTIVLSGLLGGCRAERLTGKATDLELVASISTTSVRVGETATLTFRIRNASTDRIALTFPSSCQVLPYIETASGTRAYPAAGDWGCYAAITNLELAAGEERTIAIEVRGGAPQPAVTTGVPLQQGRYHAFALLGQAPDVRERSNVVEFSVVP